MLPTRAIAATWPLLLGMGVLMLGPGLQSTLLGVRATLEGFPTVVTGAIMSCYYLGYLVGTRIAPPLLRRLGHIRVFATLGRGVVGRDSGSGMPGQSLRLGRHAHGVRRSASRASTWSRKAGSTIGRAGRIGADCSPSTWWSSM